jgi:hypothetical protein
MFFAAIFGVEGQEFFKPNGSYSADIFRSIEFTDDNKINMVIADQATDEDIKISGAYIINEYDKVPFISIMWDNNKNEKYLMLGNNLVCFLFNDNARPYFRGTSGSIMRGELVLSKASTISASSSLIEKNIIFGPDNLNIEIGKSWVEGVTGQGIHEYLLMKQVRTASIHISIGFVSFSNPNLYIENSRPKRILISVEGSFSFQVDLEDTPNYQKIDLPRRLTNNDELRIEILEVYRGTKYEDTCINSILFDIK